MNGKTKRVIKIPEIGAEIHVKQNAIVIGNDKRSLFVITKKMLKEMDLGQWEFIKTTTTDKDYW